MGDLSKSVYSAEQGTLNKHLLAQLHSLSILIRKVCDSIRDGHMAWPEAESNLLQACSLADELEQQLTLLLGGSARPSSEE